MKVEHQNRQVQKADGKAREKKPQVLYMYSYGKDKHYIDEKQLKKIRFDRKTEVLDSKSTINKKKKDKHGDEDYNKYCYSHYYGSYPNGN